MSNGFVRPQLSISCNSESGPLAVFAGIALCGALADTMLLYLRSILFNAAFYLCTLVQMILYTPFYFLLPRKKAWIVPKLWARVNLWLQKHIAGTDYVIEGLENIPQGAYICAPKHQSAWDTYAFLPRLDDPVLILTMVLVMIVVMIESTGMFLALSDMTEKPLSQPALSSGLRMDGLGTLLGGIFNTFPYTSFSQNVGLVGVTGIRSRFVCVAGGAILVVLGLIPKMGALVEALPTVVLGGAGIVMFGMVAATGIRILGAVDFKGNRNNLFIVAIALGFGMIPVIAPNFHMWLPKAIGPLIDSGILLASVVSVILNALFNGATGDAEGLRDAAMATEA